MSNPTPEQLDLTQPIDRVVRYVEERLNAWAGLLAATGFKQDDGARAAQHITDEVQACERLRSALARQLGVPPDAADALLLERLRAIKDSAEFCQSAASALRLPPESAPDAVLSALREAVGRWPEYNVRTYAWARLQKALGLADLTQIAEQVESLVAGRESASLTALANRSVNVDLAHEVALFRERAESAAQFERNTRVAFAEALALPTHTPWGDVLRHVAKQANELAKAQQLIDRWDMEYQDLRDKFVDFRNQVSRALGVESLSDDEMLKRIGEGAAATKALTRLAAAHGRSVVDSSAFVDEVLRGAQGMRDRLHEKMFPGVTNKGLGADIFVSRVEKALSAEALMRELDEALQAHAPNHAAQAAVAGASTIGLLLEKLRSGELREGAAQHARLVEALHVGRPASEVKPDALVEWAKQAHRYRTLVERLHEAIREQLPQFGADASQFSVINLTANVEAGYIKQAIWAHGAWCALVERFNSRSGKAALLDFESAGTKETLLSAIDMSARLRQWVKEAVAEG